MTQLTHYTSKFNKKQFPITIICDNISNAPNIGSLFRTADAFGVEQLIFCGDDIPMGRKMTKTARATEKVVPFKIEANALEAVMVLKQEGYQIIALEITSNSNPLHSFTYNQQFPTALVIGDENFGVSEEVLKNCDHILHIEMFGQNSSMNVVQATSVALYELTKQMM